MNKPGKVIEYIVPVNEGARNIDEMFIGVIQSHPQLIRCKDCKHRDPEDKKCDCGHDVIWQLPRHDDWYCADAERKK